jgi:hypothetical protein
MRQTRKTYNISVGKPERRTPGGRMILDWILEKWGGKLCTALVWLRIKTSGGLL